MTRRIRGPINPISKKVAGGNNFLIIPLLYFLSKYNTITTVKMLSAKGSNMEPIHWYPGHMAKAKRELGELMKCIDLLLEIRDARLPVSSHNSDLEPILNRRPVIVVLNKTDLADPAITGQWDLWFAKQNLPVVEVNGRNGQGINRIWKLLNQRQAASTLKRALRVGVIGMPNVGKSSVLNRLLGVGTAQTGNRPGITRGKQWVKRGSVEILDTPGMLPPKIADQAAGIKLALIGTIHSDLLPVYDLALELLRSYGEKLFEWEKQGSTPDSPEAALQWYTQKRGFLIKGGEPDLNRAVQTLLQEFRNGRLGRISLEIPMKGID
jgi:ribosome biogenesis GTPase A